MTKTLIFLILNFHFSVLINFLSSGFGSTLTSFITLLEASLNYCLSSSKIILRYRCQIVKISMTDVSKGWAMDLFFSEKHKPFLILIGSSDMKMVLKMSYFYLFRLNEY